MDERRMQFRVGVMVLAALLVAAILIVLFGKAPSFYGTYTVTITVDRAPGVAEKTPVRKGGILIGRVTKVELVEDEEGREDARVRITAEIQNRWKLYEDEECYIRSNLLGDTVLEFERAAAPPPAEDPSSKAYFEGPVHAQSTSQQQVVAQRTSRAPLRDGAEVEGRLKPSPIAQLDDWEERVSGVMNVVEDAGLALTTASQELEKAAEKVFDLLEEHDEDIEQAISQVTTSLGAVENVAQSLTDIIGDQQTQQELRQAVSELPDTLRSMKNTMALAETNLRNLKSFTDPLRAGAAQRVDQIYRTVDQLSELIERMNAFSQKLNNPQGSLSRLLEDQELYHHLTRAARNIDELTQRLKPIVDDARVFSDKIARHPELLGVRGAIQRNPGIK